MAPKPATPPRPQDCGGRALGAITLARHGEPALSRRIRLNAAGYRRWWAAYEDGGILSDQSPPGDLLARASGAGVIFASTRRRAVETAAAAAGGRAFIRDAVFIEAPLPPPALPRFVRLSPRAWGFVARSAWWWFGHHEGQETQAQALARACLAADRLELAAKTEGDVLVIAHGFFNMMIGRELKRRGWRLVENRGFRYWAQRRFERR